MIYIIESKATPISPYRYSISQNKSPRLNAPALPIIDFYKLVGAVIPRSPKPCAEET